MGFIFFMRLHYCCSIRLIPRLVILRPCIIWLITWRFISRWGASIMIQWTQILIFQYLIIMQTGRYFTGTLRRSYHQSFRIHVLGLWLFVYFDANHTVNAVTRHLHTVNIRFIQNSPIILFSKKHNIVEAATFGSELVALRICKHVLLHWIIS